jgi:hypothetical protein
LLALALTSCGWAKASPWDHAAYRKTRTEQTFEARIAAAGRYLEERPDGAYAEQVRKYFDKAEPVFYATRRTTKEGLEAYLRALPRGPHALDVRNRLAGIEAERRRDPLVAAAELTRERLEEAAESRRQAQQRLAGWLETLMDRRAYESPIATGPKELVVAFSLELPQPACAPAEGPKLPARAARVCTKDVILRYTIPVERRLEELEMAYLIEIVEDGAGIPLRATIAGEELFSRLDETFAKEERRAESVRDRLEAVSRAVDFVEAAFERRVSLDAGCKKPVVAPEVLRLECGGLRVVAAAGADAGALDEIVLEPAVGP